MKKTILPIFLLASFLLLFAQDDMTVFLKNLSVVNLHTNAIDSIKFSSDKSQMDIYQTDQSTKSIEISSIDSINFTDAISSVAPVIGKPQISNLSGTSTDIAYSIISTGNSSITETGICYGTESNPTTENSKVAGNLATTNQLSISELSEGVKYYVRAYAITAAETTYSTEVNFTTGTYSLPTIEAEEPTYNYNTNKALCVVNVTSNGGCSLTERGICWSTSPNPTTNDEKFSSGTSVGKFYGVMSNLELDKKYYVRPFATNCVGTAYGNQVTVIPLPGNVTYTLDMDSASSPTYYNLIKTAMDSACWYYSRYTTFRCNIYVYQNDGIPTAQASYHGSIGFGSNTRYMWVGTAMHEMAHYMGSGTTSSWQSHIVNGVWNGTTASTLLLNATGETLKGDSQHFWPYGINQKEEITNLGSVSNQQKALILHCKLVKAMCVNDSGLPTSW
ncbi:MAG: hypothetical protein PHH37_10720 [Paludibacter sp.]|nr:hypothetical protein [Paludibacter sp.]